MTFKPLKQTDPRWANKKLGNSNLGKIGCVCTCAAMAAGTTPDKVVDACDFTPNGEIYWTSLAKIGLSFVWRGYKYSNSEVLKYIADCGFCLVEVLHPSGIKHWILAIGGGKILDPLTGRECSLSKYKNLTGFCSLKKIKQEEPMPDALQECLKQHGELVDELTELKEEHEKCSDNLKVSKKLAKDTQGFLETCENSKAQMISRKDYNLLKAELTSAQEVAEVTPTDEKFVKLILYLGLSGGLGYLTSVYVMNDPALTVAFMPVINIVLYILEQKIGILKKVVAVGRSK